MMLILVASPLLRAAYAYKSRAVCNAIGFLSYPRDVALDIFCRHVWGISARKMISSHAQTRIVLNPLSDSHTEVGRLQKIEAIPELDIAIRRA